MFKRSTMLKVVSILMIIFGAIAFFTLMGSMALINSVGAALGGSIEQLLELSGVSVGTYRFALILGIIASIFEILAGILGLALKNKKTLVMIGCICIIIQVVSLIFSIVAHSFAWTNLIGFILPILYFIGAKQCQE